MERFATSDCNKADLHTTLVSQSWFCGRLFAMAPSARKGVRKSKSGDRKSATRAISQSSWSRLDEPGRVLVDSAVKQYAANCDCTGYKQVSPSVLRALPQCLGSKTSDPSRAVFIEHLHGAFSEAVTIATGTMEACPLILHITHELQKLGPDVAIQHQAFHPDQSALWHKIMELLSQLNGLATFVKNCQYFDSREAPLPADETMNSA
jgi:hypothetical protein